MRSNKIFAFLLLIISHTVLANNLYHIIDRNDWNHTSSKQEYKPNSLSKDGFIHLSSKEQVAETADIFFKGKHKLLLLEFNIPSNDRKLKWESAIGGVNSRKKLFPHYYAPLPLSYLARVYIFEPNHDGHFSFPTKILKR